MARLRFVALFVCFALLTSCVSYQTDTPLPKTLYASFYPLYALSAQVVKDVPGMRLYCLAQPQDGCLRSYTLSDWDAALLSGADAVILGGRGLESFEAALAGGSIPVVTAMGGLSLIGNGEPQEDDHLTGENPWLFLSVAGAKQICASVAGSLALLDPDYAPRYEQNLLSVNARLDELLADMRSILSDATVPPVILLQEGLAYFAREMGIGEYATLSRESGVDYVENDLAELLSQMDETGYGLVLIEKQAPQALVEAITSHGYTVCLVDILSTRFATDFGEGYFTAMLENAQALRAAF